MHILFFCPVNPERPTGGVLVIFRCVEMLRSQGFQASVVALPLDQTHKEPGWFDSSSPVISWAESCQLPPKDCVFVLPEDFSMAWHQESVRAENHTLNLSQAHMVLFAQNRRDMYRNLYKQWPKLPERKQTVLNQPGFLGVLCVSDLEQTYWKTIYPDIEVWCKPNSINTSLFQPAPERENIALFLGKPAILNEARHTLLALRHSGLAKNWRFLNLHGKNHREVASLMSKADLFMSFGTVESFGLAAAEAMASGCIVIGYHGGVPEEFFNPLWSYPVRPLDHLGYLHAFQQLKNDRTRAPEFVEQKRQLGRAHIERNFSPKREAQALQQIFEAVLQRARSRRTA